MPFCGKCNFYSDRSADMKRHLDAHARGTAKGNQPKTLYKCLLCQCPDQCREELFEHLSSAHGIFMSTKYLSFDSEILFLAWKTEVERNTAARYVLHGGGKKNTVHYYCHRDGIFKSSSNGKRRLKVLGSNKINSCCPARIKAVTEKSSGTVRVEFVETHVGHKQDLGRLHLSKDERLAIATKIAAGVPFNEILRAVRKSIHDEEVSFIHLMTKKDLWNIQQEFNLNNEAVRHPDDSVSVQSWVTEHIGKQVVRFYKPQGTVLSSHEDLSSDDFVLIIANESQLAMLERFGNDCICVDGTHGLNPYDFELTTIMVVDELRQGFPCAFMLSNRSDAACMKIFFSVIRDELDGPINPKIFMSDMAEAYRNAWCAVFPSPDNVLYCAWHVDNAWKKNLGKVKDNMKKAEVYKTVRILLEETDTFEFEQLLESALFDFESDPGKKDFGKYFASEYAGSTKKWAYCYRAYLGLNANNHLEGLHKNIKHVYCEGNKIKRLDKCIHMLMQVIRDKLFDRLITFHRGKVSKKISDIRRRHDAALQMKNIELRQTEEGWFVSSSSSQSFHSIVCWKPSCTCELRCTDCNICIHSFKCGCLDSSIKWVICRHIHYLAMNLISGPTDEVAVDDEATDMADPVGDVIIEDAKPNNIQEIVKELSQPSSASISIQERKNQLIEQFIATVDICQTMDHLDLLQNALLPLKPTIQAAINADEVLIPKKGLPNTRKKKMTPQKNIYSTKKKSGKKRKLF